MHVQLSVSHIHDWEEGVEKVGIMLYCSMGMGGVHCCASLQFCYC